MRILMVCAEFAPWAKTGGLADAVAGLSDALAARGHDVRVLMPSYAHLAGRPRYAVTVAGVGGRYALDEVEPARALEHAGRGTAARPRVLLVDLDDLVADRIYTGDERDGGRFLRLCAAAAAFGTADGWHPHVVHCHDWHAALTPVLQRAGADDVPSVLTLHNIGYQGVFPDRVLREHGFASLEPLLPPGARSGDTVNFLRAGIIAADRVTTVSPTYALEIRRPEFGMGLEDVVNARGDDVSGILNGVDYGVWSPECDSYIAEHYSASDLAPKRRLKRMLLERLGLGDGDAPLIGVVTRLAAQKGVDLIAAAIPALLAETTARVAVLGSGEAALAAELRRLAAGAPARVAFQDAYDESLAHGIFAGADLTLVPSRYEPCGLTQMYALRYGTIPVVRATGGLADTVRHFDPATGEGNGSVFRDPDPQGLLWGVRTALAWFEDRSLWARLVENAMASDFSWRTQAPHYEELYRSVL